MNKLENAKRNIIFGFVNKVISLFCPFIIRTIIIWKLGMEYVGLSSLFTSILQVLSLTELGFSTAVVYSMYKPIANKDDDTICALLNFYRRVYRIIGSVILIAGLLITPFLNKIVSGNIPRNINLESLFIIYLLNTVISYLTLAYKQSVLIANQRIDIDNNITSIVNIFMYICQIIVLLVTRNYYCYIVILPICTLIINYLRSRIVEKLYPTYYCKGEISKSLKKDLYKKVYGLMLTRICQVFRNSLDSIVISSFLGLVVLGKYQNYYYVINTIIGFLLILTNSIVAGIGNNIVTKTVKENYKQFNIFMFAYNWISSWCTICLCCLYQPFMKIWVGESNMFSMVLVLLMCMYFYSLKTGDIVAVYKEAAGIYWEDRKRPIVESIINLILNIFLVKCIGIYGVVLSTIISIVFVNIPWSAYILFRTYFKHSMKIYFKKILLNCLILFFTMGITFFACSFVKSAGILELIIKTLVCIVIPNVIFILINIENKNLTDCIKIVKEMIIK